MEKQMTVPIVTQIEQIAETVPGWTPVDQLFSLFNLVFMNANLAGDVAEIGSWCGRSSVVLGLAVQLTGKCKVYCVDLFPGKCDWKQNPDGTYSFEVVIDGKAFGGYQQQTVWREPYTKDILPLYEKHESVFEIFHESVHKYGLANTVVSHKGDSTTFVAGLSRSARFKVIFIDGDHSYAAVCKDIKNMQDYLVEGGWICFDDAFTKYDGVTRAIEDLIIGNNRYEACQQLTRKFFVARSKFNS
jgi:predicted O-methyltransferase YrrM